jgi:hypothetical protein
MAIERYLSIKISAWRKKYFNSQRAVIVSIGIVVLFTGINFHTYSALAFSKPQNGSYYGKCYGTPTWDKWRMVSVLSSFRI